MDSTASTPLFRMEGVSKRYGGVNALVTADLTVEAGRIHGVLGENGAGKSTLMKIMAGVVQPDEGRMMLDGNPVGFANPAAANAAGIVCIFQELSLVPELSVADNICISNPPKRFGLIDQRRQRRIAEEALARAGGADIHPLAPVKDLPLSRRQLVEIAKMMIGRECAPVFPPKPAPNAGTETPALEVHHLSWNNRLKDISLTARAGEIVG